MMSCHVLAISLTLLLVHYLGVSFHSTSSRPPGSWRATYSVKYENQWPIMLRH
jgi:hypothetical protein